MYVPLKPAPTMRAPTSRLSAYGPSTKRLVANWLRSVFSSFLWGSVGLNDMVAAAIVSYKENAELLRWLKIDSTCKLLLLAVFLHLSNVDMQTSLHIIPRIPNKVLTRRCGHVAADGGTSGVCGAAQHNSAKVLLQITKQWTILTCGIGVTRSSSIVFVSRTSLRCLSTRCGIYATISGCGPGRKWGLLPCPT